MLKLVKSTLTTVVVALIYTSQAQANVGEALQNICTIIKADDKGELRKKMKRVQADYKLSLKDYYQGISCNGQSLIRTAMLNNSVETGTLLVKKMPKGNLNAPEQDGKTVITWAFENGLHDSAIVSVLKARI